MSAEYVGEHAVVDRAHVGLAIRAAISLTVFTGALLATSQASTSSRGSWIAIGPPTWPFKVPSSLMLQHEGDARCFEARKAARATFFHLLFEPFQSGSGRPMRKPSSVRRATLPSGDHAVEQSDIGNRARHRPHRIARMADRHDGIGRDSAVRHRRYDRRTTPRAGQRSGCDRAAGSVPDRGTMRAAIAAAVPARRAAGISVGSYDYARPAGVASFVLVDADAIRACCFAEDDLAGIEKPLHEGAFVSGTKSLLTRRCPPEVCRPAVLMLSFTTMGNRRPQLRFCFGRQCIEALRGGQRAVEVERGERIEARERRRPRQQVAI